MPDIHFCNETQRDEFASKMAKEPRDIDIKPIYTYLCPVIIIVCFFSIICNAIIMSISRQGKLVNKSPILLLSLNLAVTDLIASLLNALSIISNSYLPEVYGIRMGSCLMLVFELVRCAALVSSALHLLALAFVHYRGIVNPLHYRSTIFFSQHLSRTINIISLCCWIIPLTIMIALFSSIPCQGFQTAECDYLFLLSYTHRRMLLSVFALPLILMSIIYVRIFVIISRHQRCRRLEHKRSTTTTATTPAATSAATAPLPSAARSGQCAACVRRRALQRQQQQQQQQCKERQRGAEQRCPAEGRLLAGGDSADSEASSDDELDLGRKRNEEPPLNDSGANNTDRRRLSNGHLRAQLLPIVCVARQSDAQRRQADRRSCDIVQINGVESAELKRADADQIRLVDLGASAAPNKGALAQWAASAPSGRHKGASARQVRVVADADKRPDCATCSDSFRAGNVASSSSASATSEISTIGAVTLEGRASVAAAGLLPMVRRSTAVAAATAAVATMPDDDAWELCTCDNRPGEQRLERANTIGFRIDGETRATLRCAQADSQRIGQLPTGRLPQQQHHHHQHQSVSLGSSLRSEASLHVARPTSSSGNNKHEPLASAKLPKVGATSRLQQQPEQSSFNSSTCGGPQASLLTNNNYPPNQLSTTTMTTSYEPQRRHIHAQAVPQTNTKALVTTLLILGTYFISYVPAIIFQVLTCVDHCPYPLDKIPFSKRLLFGSMTTLLLIAKSIVDPLIYSYRMNEIQQAINRYLSKRRSKSNSQHGTSMHTSQRHTANYAQPIVASNSNNVKTNEHNVKATTVVY